jgi:hypothetical protein
VKPLVTFADPEAVVRTYLLAEFAARSEVYKPATITNAFPTSALSGNATHVQVELDGANVEDYPVTERATVRITCYAAPTAPTNAKNLASLTQGLVTRFPGSADAHSVDPLTGRIKTVDPTTKNHLVTFTVRVNLKATQLAS